jgi:hypothetical protein
MPTPHESARSDEVVELREWYLESLLPKLTRAARSGIVEAAAAEELERRFSELFGPPRTRADAA